LAVEKVKDQGYGNGCAVLDGRPHYAVTERTIFPSLFGHVIEMLSLQLTRLSQACC